MSDNNINVTAPIHAATKKGKLAAAKEVFLEGDTQTVEKEIQDINSRHNALNTKHESLSKTVQGIAATGGASTATNVTYDNTNSGMTAENIQDAVDKLAKEKADSSDVTKQLDKVTIKDEDGTVVDTPFRYIQNEEFIFAKVDAEDKLLFGIQWDGTPKFGKTSEVEDRLQSQVTLLAEKVATIMGDEDTTNVIDTMNELKTFFANIANTQSLTDILANLDNVAKNLDKTTIKDEEGNVQDTPFRIIENKEFLLAVVDYEDRVLYGIYRATGKPYYPLNEMYHVIQNEEYFAAWLDADDKVVLGIRKDGEIIGEIHAVNALKQVIHQLQSDLTSLIDNTQTLTSILENLNVTIDKVAIKDEAGEIQDSPFRVISNDEFLWAVVDSEYRVLYGIYRDTGKPYYPLNEMYHVEQNEEFFAVWFDADNHILLGIRRDGQIIGEIHAVNALKQVISQLQTDLTSLQEKVGTIDTNLKELLDIFSLQENPEYMAVEKDADGRVLSATYNDGSHYSHNLKSETIDAKVDKKDNKSLIDTDVADAHSTLEDLEGRTEITTDAEGRLLGYRDSEGTRHEHKISANHINLSDDAANEINEAFKSAGIKMENPSDFSKDRHIELPIPRIAAQVRIYALKLPTSKQADIKAEIEYNDKNGNYFRKPVILNSQGSSSMNYIDMTTGERGNLSIDLNDGSEIKFGDFPTQDSFHLKKYYIDVFRGQCIVGYWLMEQVYKTRPVGKRYPYEMLSEDYSPYTGNGNVDNDFYTCAKCHPDGFPINITWINTKTNEEKDMGIYAWNLKKSKEVYHANKKKPEHIILDGDVSNQNLFGGTINWNTFEVRNPKSLIDINGEKYDGDNPKELSDTDKNSKKVKEYITRLSGVKADLDSNPSKDTFVKYFIVETFIDYFLISQVLYNLDGFSKNWIWCTWDGLHWTPTLYDVDSIFGSHWNGTYVIPNSDKENILGTNAVLKLNTLYADEIETRYKKLRDSGVFTVENIVGLLGNWLEKIGYDNIKKEITLYADIPSYRDTQLNDGWKLIGFDPRVNDDYNEGKTYNTGSSCVYKGYKFEATTETTGIPPLKGIYEHSPKYCGFFNSIKRVSIWLTNRIAFLDKTYNYNNV